MRTATRRVVATVVAGLALGGAGLALGAAPAGAHPLGNATVSHYDGLRLTPTEVVDLAVEDAAEIPTLQRQSVIDADRDGTVSPAESSTYAARRCAQMAAAVDVVVDGARAPLVVARASYAEKPGVIRLVTGRLECDLKAPVDLERAATVSFTSRWNPDGVGWREVTAEGSGVSLTDSPFPAASISDELRQYPGDLLASPLAVRTGTFATTPGSGASTYAAVADVPGAGVFVRALDEVTRAFESRVGAQHLTVGLLALTVLLAVLLGAGHALLPGHGKTIMAAYLVGRRGRLRDVVAVGATVTLTHTASVLALGLAVSASAAFAPTAAVRVLAVVSGLIVTGVGVFLLASAVRRGRAGGRELADELVAPVEAFALAGSVPHHAPASGHAPRAHDHHGHHEHGPGHDHPHDHAATAPHRHGVFGAHSHEPRGFGRGGLIGLGVAGGLVPSPSALLVLLAAFALGRGWLGVVLVLAYGVGMAGTLTAAGLLLVRLRDRLARAALADRFSRAARVVALLPFMTAGLVLLIGAVLTARALSGSL